MIIVITAFSLKMKVLNGGIQRYLFIAKFCFNVGDK